MVDSATTVWITRPTGQADSLLALLNALLQQHFPAITAAHSPLFDIAPLPAEWPLLSPDGIIFISKNAVWHSPALPTACNAPLYAVGPVTAEALAERFPRHPTPAKTPEHDFSSEGLLALPALQNVMEQNWLIVRGVGGRETLKHSLLKRGAAVTYCECYARQTLTIPEAATTSTADIWVVTSAATLQALTPQLNIQSKMLIVSSPRLATLAKSLGWQAIHLAENATDAALFKQISATLGQLQKQSPQRQHGE